MIRLAKVLPLSTRLHTRTAVHGHEHTRKDTFMSDRSMLATSASDLQSFSSASPCFAKSVCMKLVDVAHS
jgi:hypothetical protein